MIEQDLTAEAFNTLPLGDLERIEFGPGCWIWVGGLDQDGYAVNGRHQRQHRFVYERLIGPIPQSMVIDHLCRVRRCVKPTHMEPVTNATNVLRGEGIGATNLRKTHCKNGHELTAENTYKYQRQGKSPERGCVECRRENVRRHRAKKKGLTMGDIGVPTRRREYEPIPESEPIKEPAAPTPEREPEKVPA